MSDGGELLREGRLIGGRYRLVERAGAAGTGTVWRARDELAGRDVAVKQPRLPGDPGDETRRRAAHRLYREARAAARVDHPSAVSIHDVVEEDGVPWIVMELIRGESLHEVLGRGPVPAAESARIGLAVLGALRAAHSVGIVHRDVKPANVLLGPHGRVVLTDFGIAQAQGDESIAPSGEFVGSLEFVAPERMSGPGAGPASDLWSLGVLLYAAVEGRSPFRRTTAEPTPAALLAADPPEPEKAGMLGPLIVRMLAKDPERRPEPSEVAAGLRAAAEGCQSDALPEHEPKSLPDSEPKSPPQREPKSQPESGRAPEPESGSDPQPEPGRAYKPEPGQEPEPKPGGAPGGQESVPEAGQRPDAEPESGPRPDAERGSGPRPEPESGPRPEPEPQPGPRPRVRVPIRPAPAALLAALLVGGIWLGTSSFVGARGDDTAGHGGSRGADRGVPSAGAAPAPWTAHPEPDMGAVLSLPEPYAETVRQGTAADQPRIVVYGNGADVEVRLTQWDAAPRSPLSRAYEIHSGWERRDTRTRYTRTTLDGQEAVLADTTHHRDAGPVRVMHLIVRTGDGRMYELRVDMPKGTPAERTGTAVFRGARDRLKIGEN
ncbi:serine/threonine protein kinase [Streptomyces sp. AS58]|uniref:protein kinase domain-containing protein n=1 Tax=Streptomyces sp. AS58 TaxID=1519489 RepID=UPI0006B01105|nr:protein kinase [Streptomyces sp. AS58]KOV65359.1 serine/threonine protein kinase [Streptomyces sp. AS58]